MIKITYNNETAVQSKMEVKNMIDLQMKMLPCSAFVGTVGSQKDRDRVYLVTYECVVDLENPLHTWNESSTAEVDISYWVDLNISVHPITHTAL